MSDSQGQCGTSSMRCGVPPTGRRAPWGSSQGCPARDCGADGEAGSPGRRRLAAQGIGATVVDPRWVVPVAQSVIDIAAEHRLVITIEDGVRVGGIGTRIRQDLRAAGVDTAVTELGLPDEFLPHGSREGILEMVGLTPQTIARDVVAQVLGSKIPVARPLRPRTVDSRLN